MENNAMCHIVIRNSPFFFRSLSALVEIHSSTFHQFQASSWFHDYLLLIIHYCVYPFSTLNSFLLPTWCTLGHVHNRLLKFKRMGNGDSILLLITNLLKAYESVVKMQDSLGGNSKTIIIANISPSSWYISNHLIHALNVFVDRKDVT